MTLTYFRLISLIGDRDQAAAECWKNQAKNWKIITIGCIILDDLI